MIAELAVPTPILFAFATVVGLVFATSAVAVWIRRQLPGSGPEKDSESQVEASLFGDKLKYLTSGPIAEFVVLVGTIAFIVSVFWLLLTR